MLQELLLSVRPQKETLQEEETQGSVLLGLPSLQRALPCLQCITAPDTAAALCHAGGCRWAWWQP